MKIEKYITMTETHDIDIMEVTLLSLEEARETDANLLHVGDWWWLRSPGIDNNLAANVYIFGDVDADGYGVDNNNGVRPALRISNLQASNLQIGDQFAFAGEQWTVISKDKALCDRIIGKTLFRKDWKVPNANDYEKSDVKIWLERWALENGIMQKENKNESSS